MEKYYVLIIIYYLIYFLKIILLCAQFCYVIENHNVADELLDNDHAWLKLSSSIIF